MFLSIVYFVLSYIFSTKFSTTHFLNYKIPMVTKIPNAYKIPNII
jgi:hypothetical protein